jgi:transposase
LDDGFTEREDKARPVREKRLRRSVAELRRIVELSFEPGMSVAGKAQAENINANQIFTWRREYRNGQLVEPEEAATSLLQVVMASACSEAGVALSAPVSAAHAGPDGAIHIDLLGRASITVEPGADSVLLRTILTTLASNDRVQGNPALESLRR